MQDIPAVEEVLTTYRNFYECASAAPSGPTSGLPVRRPLSEVLLRDRAVRLGGNLDQQQPERKESQ